MCGIAGIFAHHCAASPVDRDELRGIRDYMAARGPDGKGEWYSDTNRVGLAHRRLAIIDLSDRAAQPMVSADGQLVISYNGEIYNHHHLRQDLKTRGYIFRTESDTEVLLNLYAEKGEAMVGDLRGMFAFILWDIRKQGMLLARDPYGIKPLYTSDDGKTLRVASQVKALLTSPRVSRLPEPAGLAGYYLFGTIPEPYTLYQEIHALPAGCFQWSDTAGLRAPVQYFSLAKAWAQAGNSVPVTPIEVRARIHVALADSVRHHMVADVAVGAFLSAGIDSGALVGLMADMGTPPTTVTVAFDEFRGQSEDETPLAALIAAHYGVRHSVYRVSASEFKTDWPAILVAMDQPSIDGINTWFAAKAARAQGLKVAISGLGGDELFGGYPSFHDIPRWVRLFGIPSRIPQLGRLARIIGAPLASRLSPKAWGLLECAGTFHGAWLVRRGLFMPWELPDIIGAEQTREGLKRLAPLSLIKDAMHPDPNTAFGRIAAMEASLYMRNQLLRDTDWAGMAHSLEIRVPLVDHILLERVAPLVCRQWSTAKNILATAPRKPLPAVIINRPKTGFAIPFADWIQQLPTFDVWRRVPLLAQDNNHWSRRLAYAVLEAQTA